MNGRFSCFDTQHAQVFTADNCEKVATTSNSLEYTCTCTKSKNTHCNTTTCKSPDEVFPVLKTVDFDVAVLVDFFFGFRSFVLWLGTWCVGDACSGLLSWRNKRFNRNLWKRHLPCTQLYYMCLKHKKRITRITFMLLETNFLSCSASAIFSCVSATSSL